MVRYRNNQPRSVALWNCASIFPVICTRRWLSNAFAVRNKETVTPLSLQILKRILHETHLYSRCLNQRRLLLPVRDGVAYIVEAFSSVGFAEAEELGGVSERGREPARYDSTRVCRRVRHPHAGYKRCIYRSCQIFCFGRRARFGRRSSSSMRPNESFFWSRMSENGVPIPMA